MACKPIGVSLAVVLLGLGGACGDDDAPSTNTAGGSSTPTEDTDGNALNETATTPVAAGEDSIVQGNQPMQTAGP
jgi:hypothetical protein